MSYRSTYRKPEGVTVMGGLLLAVAFAVPVWVVLALVVWAVTR